MITTPDYSFVEFSTTLSNDQFILPVNVYTDLKFSVKSDASFLFGIANRFGLILWLSDTAITALNGYYNIPDILSQYVAIGDLFRVIIKQGETIYYSNLIERSISDYNMLFSYSTNGGEISTVMLSANITTLSSKTEKEEYTDANGVINKPYTQKRFEQDIVFDFMPEYLHKTIIAMLANPILYVDGVQCVESGDYEIDYDNQVKINGTYYQMGKCKISEQSTITIKN